ncbi:assimilatory sulfite reductase [Dendrothele bispora CBS 962.96]|uniref:assimilatory sulfite reductase (NADPH) n=1 Tax=Dendrothele bispora (strain CBS 962.96) TaxID=1314807 RepID=A0A4S8N0T2_DENBC|nr:assimilatory sulfite reductase [Dendrothele bispora CBS 962.96]
MSRNLANISVGSMLENPAVSASAAVEFLSSRASETSTVYIYDLAEQAGFGTLTKSWANSDKGTASVIDLQTRAGAGLSLVGRLSEGSSSHTANGATLTAFVSPHGLALMSPALSYLPPAGTNGRLIIQVPSITPVGETMVLSPSTASLSTTLPILPEDITVLISATPQEAVHFTQISYGLTDSHVIHLFDHFSTSREIGHKVLPVPEKVFSAGSLHEMLKQAGYSFFDYVGDIQASTVLVLLNGPLGLLAKAIARQTTGFGVVTVNVLRPWDEAALRSILPSGVRNIHVLDDVPNAAVQGPLYLDVLGALFNDKNVVYPHRLTPGQTHAYLSTKNLFLRFLSSITPNLTIAIPKLPSSSKKLMFFNAPNAVLSSLPSLVENSFLSSKALSARLLVDHDVFSKKGGITASRLLLSPKDSAEDLLPVPVVLPFDSNSVGEVDFLGVLDTNLLKSHSILTYAKPRSPVLLTTSWTAEEVSSNLPSDVLSLTSERELRLFIIDTKSVASQVGASDSVQDSVNNAIAYLAFMRLYLGSSANVDGVLALALATFGDSVEGVATSKINSVTWEALEEVDLPSSSPVESQTTLKAFESNAIAVETDEGDTVVNGARLGSWHDAAKHLMFPSVFTPEQPVSEEQYPPNPALRPEISDRTFLVTCTVNRRLTPREYDRNVFHLEFDTSGTGLKYAIGEALGVHGWNDEQEVLDFCEQYGVDSSRLITIPVVSGEDKMHTRTVFQAFQQQIDIFGRPPKSFYTDLAAYATNTVDKHALLFIGSAEGSSTFKKLSEKDTVTFADVLRMYPSARPGIETLCGLIGDIKPRHYSIASAQSVVGDRVDLLVVTVDWVTPSGSPRYGQCTKYLAGLRVGQQVTVSIKPSVMKLPPDDKQPLIMAGLGTGAAPFRAFLQHKAWLAEQGKEIGPVYYYFGSRHQSQEYLYGEEVEAFILDGVITRAGLAFSRDGPKKVYIQHKMLEDSETLARMLHEQNGVFYLCGPTWPVPDVFEALVNALSRYKGLNVAAAGDYLESLKEEERYVLEVY